MTCSVCNAPSSSDLCGSCSSRVEVVPPASLQDLRDAARKRYWMDKALIEGDERALRRCRSKGWIEPEERDEENYAERRMEAFCGARMAGASVEAAWQEVDALG